MMTMLHPATELLPPPSSPSFSSISSSDFDTESTGSFFHDRSTTLGTLMGVTTSFPTITFRSPSQRTPTITLGSTRSSSVGRRRRNKDTTTDLAAETRRKRTKRRNWWWLCSGVSTKPSSLGEFLEVERKFGVEALTLMDLNLNLNLNLNLDLDDNHNNNDGRMLFANGRVLPPPPPPPHSSCVGKRRISSLCRFPVFLAGICRGGG